MAVLFKYCASPRKSWPKAGVTVAREELQELINHLSNPCPCWEAEAQRPASHKAGNSSCFWLTHAHDRHFFQTRLFLYRLTWHHSFQLFSLPCITYCFCLWIENHKGCCNMESRCCFGCDLPETMTFPLSPAPPSSCFHHLAARPGCCKMKVEFKLWLTLTGVSPRETLSESDCRREKIIDSPRSRLYKGAHGLCHLTQIVIWLFLVLGH